LKFSSLEIGHDLEVTQGTEPPSQPFGQLEQTINGFHCAIGEPCAHEGDYSIPMLLDGTGESDEGLQSAATGPLAPPGEHLGIFRMKDVLQ
jgi:hypothetical protein